MQKNKKKTSEQNELKSLGSLVPSQLVEETGHAGRKLKEAFLENCLFDSRHDKIRKSLEDYLEGKTEVISTL